MPHPDREVLDWASAVLGAEVTVLRGLRDGDSPWLLLAGGRQLVLRVVRAERAGETATEVVAMTRVAEAARVAETARAAEPAGAARVAETARAAEAAGAARAAGAVLPVAELSGYDLAERTRFGLVLTACMPGASTIPREPDPERLRSLGAAAARISSVAVTPAPALPVRTRPIEAEDFPGMRREQGASDLLRAAEEAIAATRPDDGRTGLVHGDLWHGNTLWCDGQLTAVLDWDCAGVGPAGLDLGSLRVDAAWCHGIDAAAHVLDGWEAEAGRPASDIAYWDAVASLASPPDMGWFPLSMTLQGRPDLTSSVLLERRDAFLAGALNQLTG